MNRRRQGRPEKSSKEEDQKKKGCNTLRKKYMSLHLVVFNKIDVCVVGTTIMYLLTLINYEVIDL